MEPNKRGARKLLRALLFVLPAALLVGAGYLAKMGFEELSDRRAGERFYAQLAQHEYAAATEVPAETKAPTKTEAPTEPEAQTETEAPVQAQQPPADESAEKDTRRSELDFDALREICPDVVGWLRIEGTSIDYPIVRGEDNDFYLTHLADGTPGSAGAIMMDCANAPDFSGTLSILHGHHMRSGAMFGELDDYRNEAFYLEHPTMRLFTPAGDHDVSVLAAYTVNGYTYGYPTSFANEAAFDLFLRKALSSTGYETDVEVAYGDRLLLLSTCAYSFDGARFVVLGKIQEN